MSRIETYLTGSDVVTSFGIAGGGALTQPEDDYQAEFVDVLFIAEEKDYIEDVMPLNNGEMETIVKDVLKEDGSPISFADYDSEIEGWRLVGSYNVNDKNILKPSDKGALVVEVTVISNQRCGHRGATYESTRSWR